jgi:hypothetical protein
MGAWGPGLYSNDAALDQRDVVRSLLRLPIGPDEIIEAMRRYDPALDDVQDVDHTTAWFAIADTFYRYGIAHQPTIDRVREYVSDGRDLSTMSELGMDPSLIRKRKAILEALAVKLSTPNAKPSKRRVLTKPQPLVLEVGEIIRYPVQDGMPASYFRAPWEKFQPNGYLAGLIVEVGRSFEFFAWCSYSLLDRVFPTAPTVADCLDEELYGRVYGTLSPTLLKREGIVRVARLGLTSSAGDQLCHKPEGTPIYESPEYVTTIDYQLSLTLPGGGRAISRDLSHRTLRDVVE